MKLLGALFVGTLIATAAAWAKDIRPGELRICGAVHCRVVDEPHQARAFAELFWGEDPVVRARQPRLGAPVYQLRFKDGFVSAIITATAIRVHGLNCGRFQRGKWYRLPDELQRLTVGLRPKRLRASIPRSC
jgi:hypothetical protein